MHRIKSIALGGFAAAMLLSFGGCPLIPSRTTNQGGGNILSAGAKIVGGQLTGLTPDEVQIVTDTVADVAGATDAPQVTDEQAQAAVDFLRANNLNSIHDLSSFIEQAANDPDSVVIPPSVMALLEAGGLPQFSESDLEDLDLEDLGLG